ncbi:hypothetical protein CRG98_020089 [Punica granatum]|uniref:Uncharacterized protein n=1 Tax=Punica granatum TaxID=22663 RepID=A0A2I0JTG4_PUNGR|nr:hypothetical protein CRG98_020089 [Punica granatum]
MLRCQDFLEDLRRCRDELRKTETEPGQAEGERENLKKEIRKAQAENENLKKKIQQAEAEKENLQKENQQANAEKKNLQTLIQQLLLELPYGIAGPSIDSCLKYIPYFLDVLNFGLYNPKDVVKSLRRLFNLQPGKNNHKPA